MSSLRASAVVLSVACLSVVSGCAISSGADVDESTREGAAAQTTFSYVGQRVADTLSATHAASKQKTWNVTEGNALSAGWLLQTPLSTTWGQSVRDLSVSQTCDPTTNARCDRDFKVLRCATQADCTNGGLCATVQSTVARSTDIPRALCVGHSDAMYEHVYQVIASAEQFVDVTSLSPPDGRFEAAIRNAVTRLGSKNKAITVRLMFGSYPGGAVDTGAVLSSLTRDLPAASPMRVSVGAYRYNFDSWNHSKIVSADGATAIVGGMNLWTQHYLDKDPVHDVSMRLSGPAATETHRYANQLWNFTCNSWSFGGTTSVTSFPGATSRCPATFSGVSSPAVGTARVITVGRLGRVGDNASDDAQMAMIAAAKRTIYLTQQDLGPVKEAGIAISSWPQPLLDGLSRALARGVDVYLVLSNANSTAGGLGSASGGYSNGYTPEDTAQHIADYAEGHASYFATGTDVRALLCAHLHVAPLRPSSDDSWPDATPFAQHGKTIAVDELAFYVGSHNLYPANLAEYGFIVDDSAATATFVSTYWNQAWSNSRRVAVTGSDAPRCSLR